MPFEFTYPPLIPALSALVAFAGGVPPARGFSIVCGVVYCLDPATLFLFA